VLQAAFAAGYTRVTAMTGLDNAAALAVLERLGMAYAQETTWEGKVYALHALEEIATPSYIPSHYEGRRGKGLTQT
jgi:RimJ/RimL family protein N-acetyltransferase